MFEKTQLTIPVGSVLPFSEVRAHEMMAGSQRHLRGKIILAVEG